MACANHAVLTLSLRPLRWTLSSFQKKTDRSSCGRGGHSFGKLLQEAGYFFFLDLNQWSMSNLFVVSPILPSWPVSCFLVRVLRHVFVSDDSFVSRKVPVCSFQSKRPPIWKSQLMAKTGNKRREQEANKEDVWGLVPRHHR